MKVKLWVKSDLNGFFGLFTNCLTNFLVMASLLTVVVGFPSEVVYGTILPASGLSVFIINVYYAYMAYKLAKKTGRNDVTAMPGGPSVTHMFLIVFMILGPVYWTTGNVDLAWNAGIAWCVIEAVIEIIMSFVGKQIRERIPRVAMLGSLAGLSLTYISLNPTFNTFAVSYIGIVCLMIVMMGFVGKIRMPAGLPVGLVAIIFATVLGWATGYMNWGAVVDSLANVRFSIPIPSISRIINGFTEASKYLVAAIPLGIYNAFETMDNLESASVTGDDYPTQEAMLNDGITSFIAGLFGSPFPTACYIGQSGWKEAGAHIGYSILTGVMILILTFTGLFSLILNVIPVVGIYPILTYIGVTITSQAFTSSDIKYVPAAIVSLLPHLADWSKNVADNALSAAGTSAGVVGLDALISGGVVYNGMSVLGAGSIIVGMILGSLMVFIMDHDWKKAMITSGIGAVLSFFGFIHGAGSIGINVSPSVTVGYAITIALFAYYYFKEKDQPLTLKKEGE
ncbi:MAG: hypothetical protein J6D29_05560 [Solobacterium sp.]|nr:hypothetical protein [Solobacterium sp.]